MSSFEEDKTLRPICLLHLSEQLQYNIYVLACSEAKDQHV